MKRLVTIALGTEEQPYTKQIEADVYGDWCVHGIFVLGDPTDTPHSDYFTVSHVNTGRRLRTFRLTRDLAESLAKSLAELGPIPTFEDAKKYRDTITAFMDAADDAAIDTDAAKGGA